MSFLVCLMLVCLGFVAGFGVAWVRGLRLRVFVSRLFSELRSGRVFCMSVNGVRKQFKCVEVDSDEGSVGG